MNFDITVDDTKGVRIFPLQNFLGFVKVQHFGFCTYLAITGVDFNVNFWRENSNNLQNNVTRFDLWNDVR